MGSNSAKGSQFLAVGKALLTRKVIFHFGPTVGLVLRSTLRPNPNLVYVQATWKDTTNGGMWGSLGQINRATKIGRSPRQPLVGKAKNE